jgi:DNA ligase-1
MLQEKVLSQLFGLSRVGKVKQWQAKVVENEDHTATMIIDTGYVGGKIRPIPKLIKKGKNIGKSNETTPFDQAVSEAESKWNGKRSENYELHMIDPDNYKPRIMLPQKAANPGKGKIVYPCYIQPKLNGVCNLAELYTNNFRDATVLHHTKGGHVFETLEHLDKWVEKLNAPAPPHGELYVHGWSLQKIRSYTQKIKPDQEKLEYWLYDMAWINTRYVSRIGWIEETVALITKEFPECPIKFTPTYPVENYEEAKHYHDIFVADGFEGGVLKNIGGIYLFQHRSKDTEKMKEFEADEFEIIGGKEGVGTDAGCIIYRCITEDGKEFSARPKGSVEDRQQMLKELPDAIGKMLTVRFAEYSEDGVPQHTVGIPEAEVVRDYE